MIVSSADTLNNRLSTDSLSAEALDNVSEYEIESYGVSGSFGNSSTQNGGDSPGQMGLSPSYAEDSDRQANTTYTAISPGTIDYCAMAILALWRISAIPKKTPTAYLTTPLTPTGYRTVQEQVEIQQIATEVVNDAVEDYANGPPKGS